MRVNLSHPEAQFGIAASLNDGWLSDFDEPEAPAAPIGDWQDKGWIVWYWDRDNEQWAKVPTAAQYEQARQMAAERAAALAALDAEWFAGLPQH